MNDKVFGAMYGLALGDALGATVEFMSRDDIRRRYPDGHREIVGGGAFHWAPGQVTDDTDMALCILRGIAKVGREAAVTDSVEAVGAEFMKWRAKNPPDIGNIIRLALDSFARVGDWKRVVEIVKTDRGDHAAGNGALMRTLPVSLVFADDWERLVRVSRALSHMTHPHPEADWCSVAYNVFVVGLLHGQSVEECWAKTLAAAPLEGGGLERLSRRLRGGLSGLRALSEKEIRSSGYCVDTFEAAMWSFLTTESAEDCIVKAANLGDDADTVAAVAGGLAGARYGQSALPARWMERLDEGVRVEIGSLLSS